MGIGRDPTSGANPTENGNPVWVTPVGNGDTPVTVYVDYDGDGPGNNTDPNGNRYDVSYSLRELDQQKIFDPDGDQTGMLVYVLASGVKLAAAWGQDPSAASAGAPGLDVGTSVPPFPLFSAGKNATLYADNDSDGFISPGDELEYTIVINNISRTTVPDVILQDNLPAETTYVPDSTYNGATQIPDAGSTLFPLDEGGVNVGTIPVGGSLTITFRVIIIAPVSPGTTEILNAGSATAVGIEVPFEDVTPLGGIGDFVWNDVNVDGIQDASEPGIPGVVVNLYDSTGTVLIATATTDSGGYYAFTGLGSNSYIVEFVKPAGYNSSPQNQGANDALDSDADPTTGRTAVFLWTAGQSNTTIDAGFWMPVASLNIVKDATVPGNTADVAGELISYTILVENTGNQSLTTVTVSDPFVSNLTRGPDAAGDNDNVLEVGETWSYTATHTVTQAEIDAGSSIVNTATADSDQTGPDTDDASIPVTQNPALNIVKDATVPGGAADAAGEVISYTIRVENTGNQSLTTVTVSDPFVSNLTAARTRQATTTTFWKWARRGRTRPRTR